jgi:preprotein translocase subunit SecG
MVTVLLVIHLIIALSLVGVILVQRSEGGALGIGGAGNVMSARGAANFLTRATTVLAIIFIGLSLVLTIVASKGRDDTSVVDEQLEKPIIEKPKIPDQE